MVGAVGPRFGSVTIHIHTGTEPRPQREKGLPPSGGLRALKPACLFRERARFIGVMIGLPAVFEAAKYSVVEALRNGRWVEIRALRPDDRADLLAAVDRTSTQSLYRRFFAVRRSFTDSEKEFFLNVDFVNHVALVALVEEGGRPVIVGGGRYIVMEPGKAELAFAVVDQYQGQGIGAALMCHLAVIARGAGVKGFIAEVLPDNAPMLRVFEKSGFHLSSKRDPQVVHVALQLS
jgi:GNAT superfamily N-acetyltransferase